jgi:7-cyano-7-deazaguanine synthase in queuosine biosynthesis
MLNRSVEYTFKFNGISDRLSDFVRVDHKTGEKKRLKVSIDDSKLFTYGGFPIDSYTADILDLAVAIHEADRWSGRDHKLSHTIHICLPVRNVEILNSPEFKDYIESVLYWFTQDRWTFMFTPLDELRRFAEMQSRLPETREAVKSTEVALWSGGLDAMAGLCNRINDATAERYLLLGSGTNTYIHSVQRSVFRTLKKQLGADLTLTQVPIVHRGNGILPDRHLRARGLVFILLGCAYANLEGQNSLAVYENGIGAINLPFRASEIGLDHAVSVHPISLDKVSKLVSHILGKSFLVYNPFLWWTKAEMCQILPQMNVTDIAFKTISCDRLHRKQVKQCGCCSSCLLRRQSLLACGVKDDSEYLVYTQAGEDLQRLLTKSQLLHMGYQVNKLTSIFNGGSVWNQLASQHPTRLADMADRLVIDNSVTRNDWIENICSLYQRYTSEWGQGSVNSVFEAEMDNIKQASRQLKSK